MPSYKNMILLVGIALIGLSTSLPSLEIIAADQPVIQKVDCFGVLELSLTSDTLPENPFTDIKVTADFLGPTGEKIKVNGFYFADNIWMVRFVPRQVGLWKYAIELSGKDPKVKVKKNSGGVYQPPIRKTWFLAYFKSQSIPTGA